MDQIVHKLMFVLLEEERDSTFYTLALQLLKNLSAIKDKGVQEVADLCFVSTSTLVRLCQKMGFKNFTDFKNNFNFYYGFETDYSNAFLESFQDPIQGMNGLKEVVMENMNTLTDAISSSEILLACKLIHDSNVISTVGINFSNVVSMYLQLRLSLFNKQFIYKATTKEQIESMKNLKEEDLLIIFSPKGNSTVLGLKKYLTDCKAKTLLVTMNPHASLLHSFTQTILLQCDTNNNVAHIPLLFFIESLIMTYYNLYKEELLQ